MVQNPHAIYIAQFKTDCPYSGDRRTVFYYFRQDTNNNEPPDDPVSVSDVVDKLALSNQLQRNCIRLGSNMLNVCLELGVGRGRRGGRRWRKGRGHDTREGKGGKEQTCP